MEQIFLTYGFPKETVTVINMLYKDTTVMVHLPDSETDFFDHISRVL